MHAHAHAHFKVLTCLPRALRWMCATTSTLMPSQKRMISIKPLRDHTFY